MYYDNDADPSALAGQTVAIIGYGSQGHAHAQNLHESGVDVDRRARARRRKSRAARRGGRAPGGRRRRRRQGGRRDHDRSSRTRSRRRSTTPRSRPTCDAGPAAHVRPRLQHPLRPDRPAGRASTWAWSRPRAPATSCARVYQAGGGVPALFAVQHDATRHGARATSWPTPAASAPRAPASSRRPSRRRPRPTCSASSRVLCGGVARSSRWRFETLVEAGYQPELAYFETMHELKLIVDLMYRGGLNFMRFSVSDTAEYGDYVAGPRDHRRARQGDDAASVLRDIQDGTFAERWIAENDGGARVRAAARGGPRPPDRAGRAPSCAPRWRSSTRSRSIAGQAQAAAGQPAGRGTVSGRRTRRSAARRAGVAAGHHPHLRHDPARRRAGARRRA